MVRKVAKAFFILFVMVLFFSSRILLCGSAFAIFPGEITGSNDVIAFGGVEGRDIHQNSTEIRLEMGNIDEDLYWTGSLDDVDALLIRTLERSSEMDAVFHLP